MYAVLAVLWHCHLPAFRESLLNPTASLLFEYLRKAFYSPKEAELNLDDLPDDFKDLGKGLMYFVMQILETKELMAALAKGDLTSVQTSRGNEIAAPVKSLQSSLMHLTWQAKQIAKGDYKQRVDFMGEFSDAFNTMVAQLGERQEALEKQIILIEQKNESLAQGNLVLSALIHLMPVQIIVMGRKTKEILLINEVAKAEVVADEKYLDMIIQLLRDKKEAGTGKDIYAEISLGGKVRYLCIKSFFVDWSGTSAEVLVIMDESESNKKIKALELDAYRDSLTLLYNRTFGMLTLDKWVREKRQFVVVFADLDSLKFVNDVYGHSEGDLYIINAGKHLSTVSPEAVVCRLGGDEFMVLIPHQDYYTVYNRMNEIYENLSNEEHLNDKTFTYSISYGMIEIKPDNTLTTRGILNIADERMYENKRMRKKLRMRESKYGSL